MGIAVYISVLAAAVCFFVVIFVVSRDKNITKRLSILESVIEDLNQQSHKLNKKVDPLTNSLKEVKKITSEFRVQKGSKKSNEVSYEEKALSLYKEGMNESEIAQLLGLSVNQVEHILSFNNPT